MHDVGWWFAVTVTLVDGFAFIAAMPIFFKPSRGQTRWRLTLFASIAIGLGATLGALWARTSIGAWATMIGGTLVPWIRDF